MSSLNILYKTFQPKLKIVNSIITSVFKKSSLKSRLFPSFFYNSFFWFFLEIAFLTNPFASKFIPVNSAGFFLAIFALIPHCKFNLRPFYSITIFLSNKPIFLTQPNSLLILTPFFIISLITIS